MLGSVCHAFFSIVGQLQVIFTTIFSFSFCLTLYVLKLRKDVMIITLGMFTLQLYKLLNCSHTGFDLKLVEAVLKSPTPS